METAFAGLDSRLSRDRDTAQGGLAALSGFLEAFQASTETRLEELEAAIGSGLTDARDALLAELTSTIEQLTQANADTRHLVEEETGALRSDLADALEEVRDRISTLMTDSASSITGALDEQRTTFTETARVLREDVLDRVEESRADVLSSLDELRSGVSSAARHGEETGGRLRELAEVIGSLYATIGELRIEWDARSEAAVASAREAAEAATAEFRAEVDGMMANARAAMDRQAAAIDDAGAMLNGGVARLVTAGESLLGYLAQRDQLLEQERDRVLHDALDAFAAGLSAKERRSTANRLGEVLDRRRDARDADRWRRTAAGSPAVEIPTPPEDLAALAGPIRPRGVRGSGPRRAAAAEADAQREEAVAPPPQPAPRKTAAKRSAGSKSTSKSAPRSAPKPATKTAAKAATKSAAKAATKTGSRSAAASAKAAQRPAGSAAAPAKTAAAKASGAATARRRRATLSEMPVVPSPDVAVDAAVGPAPAEVVAEPAPTAPETVPRADAVAAPEPAAAAEQEPETPTADTPTSDTPDGAADADSAVAAEAEPVPTSSAKPWWNPTGGDSDEPEGGGDTPD